MPKENALIAAYLFDGEGGAKAIGWEEIAAWSPDQGILWVHLNYTTKRARQWLSKESGLDKLTARTMGAEETRPRAEVGPQKQWLMTTLRGVNLNPDEDPEDMVSVRVWLDERRIISTRQRRLLSVSDLRAELENGSGPRTPGEFLSHLTEKLTARIANVVETVDDRADELEQLVLTEESRLLRPRLSDLRRQAILLRRYLAPMREALRSLPQLLIADEQEKPFISEMDLARIREVSDQLTRCVEDLDAARDRASITQEELSSRISEQIDHRMYVLSVAAVIFLPLTFLTGLLGINVGGIPGANNQLAFAIVSFALIVIAGIMLWYFHRKHWI